MAKFFHFWITIFLFNKNNIGLRRPGNGLPAVMIEEIFGKKSANNISKGDLLKIDDFT